MKRLRKDITTRESMSLYQCPSQQLPKIAVSSLPNTHYRRPPPFPFSGSSGISPLMPILASTGTATDSTGTLYTILILIFEKSFGASNRRDLVHFLESP